MWVTSARQRLGLARHDDAIGSALFLERWGIGKQHNERPFSNGAVPAGDFPGRMEPGDPGASFSTSPPGVPVLPGGT